MTRGRLKLRLSEARGSDALSLEERWGQTRTLEVKYFPNTSRSGSTPLVTL
uniref:Uncharacterized protein n=1 Tax=Anguilla anguilla TaxID=7936 RepID=A0A0E9SQT4_ANGAN